MDVREGASLNKRDLTIFSARGIVTVYWHMPFTRINKCLEVLDMIIAVTYEQGEIFQHFGHTEQFKLYKTEGNQIVSSEVVGTNGSGHGALAGFLKDHQVEVLICGGIGGGAKNALSEAGIKLYGGVSGKADEAVAQLLSQSLKYNPEVRCSHHDGEAGGGHHGHGEGSHGCGHHCHF